MDSEVDFWEEKLKVFLWVMRPHMEWRPNTVSPVGAILDFNTCHTWLGDKCKAILLYFPHGTDNHVGNENG